MPNVRVGVGIPNPSHDVSVADGDEIWGIKLDGGIKGVQEESQTPSTMFKRGGKSRWGDYDPSFGEIVQDTWTGGMGQEEFSKDITRFFHSQNAWTLTPGRLHPVPRWQFADTDHRDYNQDAFADMDWQGLFGSQRYIGQNFTVQAQDNTNYAADKAYMWIRRIGRPGAISIALHEDDATEPKDTPLFTAKDITVTTVDDHIAVWQVFDWTGTETLSDNTVYWIVVNGAATDNQNNHWEVGVNPSGSPVVKVSSTGGVGVWTASSFRMYYRVVDADTAVKWHFFMLDADETYKVSEPASGNSTLFVWDETNDEWDSVSIKGGDNAISNIVQDVAVGNGLAHMARGTAENIWVFYHDGSDYRGRDDANADADLVHIFNDPEDGVQVCRIDDGIDYSRSDIKAFGTDLDFPSDKQKIGDSTFPALDITDWNDLVWVRTENALWSVKKDKVAKLNVGLDSVFETEGYKPILAKDLYLYIAWDYSLERLYGSTLDDIGPWRGAGLPKDYQGTISALCSGIGVLFAAIDGGTSNYSSVLAWDNRGWHTIFTGMEKGQRIRNIFWQPVSGAGGRLWISYGGDSIYMVFPQHTVNPLHDTSMNYHHEAVLETSTFNMDAERLPKLFKRLDFITEGLGTLANVAVDYKFDKDIGDSTASWIEASTIYHSPEDSVELNLGNKRRIRFRFRIRCLDADKPPKIIATVLDCIARTPVKRQWNLRVKISHLQRDKRGAVDHDPIDFYKWLLKSAQNTESIFMRANDAIMDEMWVKIEPPGLFRSFINTFQKWLAGVVTVTIRET